MVAILIPAGKIAYIMFKNIKMGEDARRFHVLMNDVDS